MARPTKEELGEKKLTRAFGELKQFVQSGDGKLTVNEMVFARLVAEEGHSYSDAYKEVFQPAETVKADSINQMASRVANRHRVKAEIDRIKRELTEDSMAREQRLAIALDGNRVRDRIAIELFAIATSDSDTKCRLKAFDMLGSMRHVDAFATASTTIDASKTQINNFGIRPDSTAGEARAALMDSVKRLQAPARQNVIDIQPAKAYEPEPAK